jgi:hypothetical protein
MSYRFRKFVRKNKTALLTASAFVLLLIAATAVSVWYAVEANRQRNEAETARAAAEKERTAAEAARADTEKARERADEQAAIAQAVNDFLLKDLLPQASEGILEQFRQNKMFEPDLKVRTVLDRASRKITGRFEKQPLVEAATQQSIGEAYWGLGLAAEAEPHLKRAFDLRRQILGEASPETLRSAESLWGSFVSQGEPAKAVALRSGFTTG